MDGAVATNEAATSATVELQRFTMAGAQHGVGRGEREGGGTPMASGRRFLVETPSELVEGVEGVAGERLEPFVRRVAITAHESATLGAERGQRNVWFATLFTPLSFLRLFQPRELLA